MTKRCVVKLYRTFNKKQYELAQVFMTKREGESAVRQQIRNYPVSKPYMRLVKVKQNLELNPNKPSQYVTRYALYTRKRTPTKKEIEKYEKLYKVKK